jgi:hypothetical protein
MNKSEIDGSQHRAEPHRSIPRGVRLRKPSVDYTAFQHREEERHYKTPRRIHWDEPIEGVSIYENQGCLSIDEDDVFYRTSLEERNHDDDERNDDYRSFCYDDDRRDAPHDRFHMSHDCRVENDSFIAGPNERVGHNSFIPIRNERVGNDSFIASRNEHVENSNWKGDLQRRGAWQNRRVVAPTREPHIEHGLNYKRPTRILKDHEGQELANRTIRDYLVFRFEQDGPRFSCWWYHLSTMQRTDILNVITQNTIPVVAAKLGEVALLLESGGPRHGARVLTDFSLKNILCPCSCSDEECLLHDYRDQLLHDLHYYVMCWEVAEEVEYQFCVKMVHQGIFPDRSCRDGKIRFVEPPVRVDPLQLHQVLVMQENAPREAMETVFAMVDAGGLREHSPFSYLLLRDSYRLAIYALIMELFDELELGNKEPEMPLARLQGCEYCRQACIATSAIQCPTCTAKWWCGAGCRHASAHGHCCPVGKPTKIRVQFS